MKPPADGRNATKTRDLADRSKRKVAEHRAALEEEWRQRLKRDGARIDRRLEDLARRAKAIVELLKRREDAKKAIEDFADILLGTLKEMQTFREVPVKGDLPKVPMNTLQFTTLLPVLIAMAAWWKLVRKLR
jgi:small-conductance mechanosensitive channel